MESKTVFFFDYKSLNTLLQMLWSFLYRSTTAIIQMVSNFFSQFRVIPILHPPQARFPLLNLDYVAIREVLNTLDPIDYINFSKAAKACRILSTVKTSYKISLSFLSLPGFWVSNATHIYSVLWTKDRHKDGTRKIETWDDKQHEIVYKYSENAMDALKEFKELYVYVRSLMSVQIDCVTFDMDKFNGRCREIVAWFRSINQEVLNLKILEKNQRQEEVQYVLDNLKFTNNSFIYLNTTQDVPLEIPNRIEGMRIRNGSWITLDYVMSLKLRQLAFDRTNLTNQDINVFYKSFIEMESNQNLVFFEINLMNPEDFVAIGLKDIPYEMGSPIDEPFPGYTPIEGSFVSEEELRRRYDSINAREAELDRLYAIKKHSIKIKKHSIEAYSFHDDYDELYIDMGPLIDAVSGMCSRVKTTVTDTFTKMKNKIGKNKKKEEDVVEKPTSSV
ncbi:unnamed protein product [Caenorhabditis nigoni]